MMKKTIAIIVLLGSVFLLTTAADAQDNKWYIGVYGFYAGENLDTDQTQAKFSGPIEIDFDNSWGFQGRLGYIINDYITVEAMGEYVFPFEASTDPNKDEMEVRNLFANAKITCPVYEKFKPYALLALGLVNAHEDIEYNGRTSETSDWGAGFRAGLGFDYYFTEKWSLGLEGAYVLGTGSVEHIKYTTLALGVGYHF
ncbi:porin family protein [Thermodesulfobacteriota bacterium]